MYVQCKLVLFKKRVLIGWMLTASETVSAEQWAAEEFSGASLPDKRLVKRLVKIAAHFAQAPTASLPKASGSWKDTKGAYRFFDHDGVSAAAILQPHQAQTGRRMAEQPTALVVQDTTGLNFADHPGTQGLGLVGTGRRGALGIWLHGSLAFTPEGAAWGVVAAQWWVRDPKQFGKAARRHRRPIEEKESYRWLQSYQATVAWAKEHPGTRFVNIADREGDLYELFALAGQHPEVGVLVRARHERSDSSGAKLSQLLALQAPAGTLEIDVPRKPGPAGQAGGHLHAPEPESSATAKSGAAVEFVGGGGAGDAAPWQSTKALVLAAGDQCSGAGFCGGGRADWMVSAALVH